MLWFLIFTVLLALIFNMYIKLICIIKISTQFLFNISIHFLRIVFGYFIVLLFWIFNTDKDADYRQGNNNDPSNDLWVVSSTSVIFLKVWSKKTSNIKTIKLRLSILLIVYLLLLLRKHIKNPDHYEIIRTCSRYESYIFDYLVSKLKYKNLNSLSQLLLLHSCNISLNTGPVHQDTSQYLSEWNVFGSMSYILSTLIPIACYQRSRNFVILQNLIMLLL